jgi:hypothetical protein
VNDPVQALGRAHTRLMLARCSLAVRTLVDAALPLPIAGALATATPASVFMINAGTPMLANGIGVGGAFIVAPTVVFVAATYGTILGDRADRNIRELSGYTVHATETQRVRLQLLALGAGATVLAALCHADVKPLDDPVL